MSNVGGRVTARNYASQAEVSLRSVAATMADRADAAVVEAMCERIAQAVHFVVPDGGAVFDDKGRGIAGRSLRLPFSLITIEYHCDVEDLQPGFVQMPKRLIIAEELTAQELRGRVRGACIDDKLDNAETYIFVSWAGTTNGVWVPGACSVAIPSAWDAGLTDPDKVHIKTVTGNTDVTSMNAVPVVTLISVANMYARHFGSTDAAMQHLVHDVGGEASVLVEFVEALSCSNVSAAVVQAGLPTAKAARRARHGKAPIYETRMLMVDVGRSSQPSRGAGGTHASPAQHLRRGHIRRLPSGKNVWVQSCVVGSASHGNVNKTYVVRRAS